jgi:adenylyltransferase/sulfurtransferase
MTAEQLDALLRSNSKVKIIDIRESYECEFEKIGALHIPMGELLNRLDQFKDDETVVLHCQTGSRGEKMVKVLNYMGFKNVHNLEGGIEALLLYRAAQIS